MIAFLLRIVGVVFLTRWMANDCIPYKKPADDIEGACTIAVIGKRFVKITGNRQSGPLLSATAEGSNYQIGPCTLAARALGVAMYDAPINGKVGIIREGIVPVTAGGTIAAGAEVQSDATGQAIVWDGTLASARNGMCMSGATVGQDAEILLYH